MKGECTGHIEKERIIGKGEKQTRRSKIKEGSGAGSKRNEIDGYAGKVAGCTVVGVVGSAHKVATAKQLGADYVINKSSSDWVSEVQKLNVNNGEGFDIAFDANGVRCYFLFSFLLWLT